MSQEKDKVFFRNFSIVVGLLAIMMVIFITAARIVGIDEDAEVKQRAESVAKMTEPMGEAVVTGSEEAAAEEVSTPGAEEATADSGASGDPGKALFEKVCVSCHGSGIPGIPQLGDKEAWAPRIAEGMDVLHDHALNGFTGKSGMMMPPRGGSDADDATVKAAVDYIVSKAK